MSDDDADVTTSVLYRVYNRSGGLLYIGVTSDEHNRFNVHACSTPWWFEADYIEVELNEYTDRRKAQQAERAAIRAEYPFYNIEHKLPGCPTCGSPTPSWHPSEDGKTAKICADQFHLIEPARPKSRRVKPPRLFNRKVFNEVVLATRQRTEAVS